MASTGGRIQKKKRETEYDEDMIEDPPPALNVDNQNDVNKITETKNLSTQLNNSQTLPKSRNRNQQNVTSDTKKIISNNVSTSISTKTTPAPTQSPYSPDPRLTPDNSGASKSNTAATSTSTTRIAKISSSNGNNKMSIGDPSWIKPLQDEISKNEVYSS